MQGATCRFEELGEKYMEIWLMGRIFSEVILSETHECHFRLEFSSSIEFLSPKS